MGETTVAFTEMRLFNNPRLLRAAALLAGASIAGGLADTPVESPREKAVQGRINPAGFPSPAGVAFPFRQAVGFSEITLEDRDPEARGYQYGLEAGGRIRECVEFYSRLFNEPSSVLQKKVGPYMECTARNLPTLHAELAGIARGSGLPLWQIYLINCRTELLAGTDGERAECTSVYLPRDRIFAQTWDWAEEFRDLMVTLDSTTSSGCRIRTFTEPGMLAKIGCNSHGISIGINFMNGAGKTSGDGVPLHIVLRHLLESTSVDDALARFLSLPVSTHGNIFIGNDSGSGAWIEISGDKCSIRRWTDEKALHTNHSMLMQSEKNSDAESVRRLSIALKALGEKRQESGKERVLRILGQTGVSLPFRDDEILGRYGTVARVMVDLQARTLEVTRF